MSTATTVKYMTRTVKTVRGMEERTKTKLEQEGWEFVSQTQGTFRTELTFRKPQPPMPWKMLGIGGGVVGVFIIIALVMGAIEGARKPAEPVAAGQTQTATAEAPAPSYPGGTLSAVLAAGGSVGRRPCGNPHHC